MKKLNIDILRLVSAFMIVAIHTYPLEFISNNVDFLVTRVLFRVAVPFFLMITGYFTLSKNNKDTLIKYTKKISLIYGISILLYLPINIYNGYFQNFNIFILLKELFLTGTFYHLWYFPALILGLWLCYFLINKLPLKKTLITVIILYIIGLLGDSYYGLISHIPIITVLYKPIFLLFDYTRNGLFYIPIFLLMGYLINKNIIKIPKEKYSYIFIFLITLILEGIITLKFNLYRHSSMYISLIPLMYLMFSYLMSNYSSNNNIRSLGTYIYILHPFFIVIMHFVNKVLKLSILNNSLVNFILVSLLSFIASFVIDYAFKKINAHKLNNVS